MNMNQPSYLRVLVTLLLALALLPAVAIPAAAHHDGSDHCEDPDQPPCEDPDPCDDPCEPTLTVTGARSDLLDNPWGDHPLYAGWTTVDLEFGEGCECKVVRAGYKWETVVDNAPFGQSAGVDMTQVDEDTWLFHNLDADVYEITFFVIVDCGGEEPYFVSTTWHQFN